MSCSARSTSRSLGRRPLTVLPPSSPGSPAAHRSATNAAECRRRSKSGDGKRQIAWAAQAHGRLPGRCWRPTSRAPLRRASGGVHASWEGGAGTQAAARSDRAESGLTGTSAATIRHANSILPSALCVFVILVYNNAIYINTAIIRPYKGPLLIEQEAHRKELHTWATLMS